MTILVLEPSLDDRNCYYLKEFVNKETALEYIRNTRDYLNEYKIYDVEELELDLKLKEVNNDDILS